MPQEKSTTLPTQESKSKPFYTLRNLPKFEKKKVHKLINVYGWSVQDNRLIIVKTGQRDPHADVQAAKGPTLQEIIKRQPGKTHMDQLANAVNAGVLVSGMKPHDNPSQIQVYDETKIPDNILDAHNILVKGRQAAEALPKDFTNGEKVFDKILDQFSEEQLKSYFEKKFPKQEVKSNE